MWYCSLLDTNKAKGVATGFHKSTYFILVQMMVFYYGRFLFLWGLLYGMQCTLVNIYCPNIFFICILSKLKDFCQKGYFTGRYQSAPRSFSAYFAWVSCRSLSHLKNNLHKTQLVDVWTILNPKKCDYFYYSKPHDSYSRIDSIFVDHYHLPLIKSVAIGSSTVSDHAPVSISFIFSLPKQQCNWKLNNFLLSETSDYIDLSTALVCYFADNKSPEISGSILSEAHKAHMRGKLSELGARKKKAQHQQQICWDR